MVAVVLVSLNHVAANCDHTLTAVVNVSGMPINTPFISNCKIGAVPVEGVDQLAAHAEKS
jgi:hypothetical protein